MESIKTILIIGLVLISAVLWFKSAPYEPPVFVEIPAVISDSVKTRIVNDANSGYVVGTDEELAKRYGKTRTKVKWKRDREAEDSLATLVDSLRIQGVRIQDSLRYVSILTDSAYYDLERVDSTLGVGFSLTIGLSDTVLLEPYNKFVHDFWLDSLTWKVAEKPVEKLNWIEWLREYPDRIGVVAFVFLMLGIV